MMIGTHPRRAGKKVFIRNQSGRFWQGWDFDDGPDALTPEELFKFTQSIRDDLRAEYPQKFSSQAAPDLLAALEHILADPFTIISKRSIELARAAIAAAKGETS